MVQQTLNGLGLFSFFLGNIASQFREGRSIAARDVPNEKYSVHDTVRSIKLEQFLKV
jgi:hypothetical protein